MNYCLIRYANELTNIMKRCYCIIGTGALGGYYGALLCRAGFDTHFLIRSDYNQVNTTGLTIKSPKGDFAIPKINSWCSIHEMPQGDVILITVKAYSNPQIRDALSPIIHGKSILVLMQNGLFCEDQFAGLVPDEQIFGALSFICVSKQGPGLINHQDYGSVKIGVYNHSGRMAEATPPLQQLIDDFVSAGIDASTVPDLLQARWEKLVWNIPFSGLSVVLNADTQRIVADPYSLRLAEAIIADVIAAAGACGKPIDSTFGQKMIDNTFKMVPYMPSIKLDFDRGKPMETEAIFGNPLRAAQKAGYEARYIESLYRILKFMEKRQDN
jgi:2-dehydropantoate 2-reductase